MAQLHAAIGELKQGANRGSWVIFPLAVCAQAVLLIAFFGMQMAGGGNKRSHLP